jgi:hypothetical protein
MLTIPMLQQSLLLATPAEMENCERMYQSQWRTAPFLASELEQGEFDTFEATLRFQHATAQMEPKPHQNAPEWLTEDWFERAAEIAAGLPPAVTRETLLVWLTNYKGEEEGIALFVQVKHLPVFVSKQASAALFS